MSYTVEIRGVEDLMNRLDDKRWAAVSKVAIEECAKEVKLAAVPYPPEGPWCQPGPPGSRWYQRLVGPRWRRVDGSIGGRNTSEQMQQSWYVAVQNAFTAKVANKAKYAPFVKGPEQPAFHHSHGWTKLLDDAKALRAKGVFARIYARAAMKVLEGK